MCRNNENKEKIKKDIKALRYELHQMILENFNKRKSFKASQEITNVSIQLDELITEYMQQVKGDEHQGHQEQQEQKNKDIILLDNETKHEHHTSNKSNK